MKSASYLGTAAVVFALSGTARAQNNEAQADAAFKEAMDLRAAGQEADACPKFAQSQRLAPAVGVTLYLADCYQRTGKVASAWKEFRSAERLARERNDKRADVAAQRAAALEPKLNRLTVVVPPAASQPGAEVQVDGAALSADSLNVALAVDPGDHVVTFAVPGQAVRTFSAHVDADHASTLVQIDVPAAPTAPAPAAATASTAESTTPSNGDGAARAAGVVLMVAGAAGIGLGTWLVTSKVQEMQNGVLCDPHLRSGALPAGIASISAGGVALLSGVTLYYLDRPGRHELALSPTMIPGGAGATFRTTF